MAEILKQQKIFQVLLTEEEARFLEGYLQNHLQPESENEYNLKMRTELLSFFKSFNLNNDIR